MTESPSPDESSRNIWSTALIAILHQPEQESLHANAAQLLELFASGDCNQALEAILSDRQRDAWVRRSVLRALRRRDIPINGAGLNGLLSEFTDDLSAESRRQRRGVWPRRLAEVDTVAELAGLADISGAQVEVAHFLRTIDGPVAYELLLYDHRAATKLTVELRDIVYGRVLKFGALDADLAWATLGYRESQSLLFAAPPPLDHDKLRRATRDLSTETVRRIFEGRPDTLIEAVDNLALPADTLVQYLSPQQLKARCLSQLASANLALKSDDGRGDFWTPIRVLSELPDAAVKLEELIRDETNAAQIRQACASMRLRLAPAPRLAEMPKAAIANYLRFLNAKKSHRPVLAWALESSDAAFQYAGLRGFMSLEQDTASVIRHLTQLQDNSLLRLVALQIHAANGDGEAITALAEAARDASHVVLRAYALRALRGAAVRPNDYVCICKEALEHDREIFDLYYAPVTSEAALGLARHPDISKSEALDALVKAALDSKQDESWWAIEAAIRSWLDAEELDINPVWYWTYLYPPHRNDCHGSG